MKQTTKSSGALDRAIGLRIRTFRRERDLSQSGLAEKLGVTFQQVQKYEAGVNRVSASRLVEIAHAVDVPLLALYPEGVTADGPQRSPELERMWEFMADNEGARLCRAFLAVKDSRLRRKIVAFVEEVSDADKKEAPPSKVPDSAVSALR